MERTNPDKIPPECAEYGQALARSYGYQGDLYLENDDLAKAQTAYDQALAIREKLAEQNPDSELHRSSSPAATRTRAAWQGG